MSDYTDAAGLFSQLGIAFDGKEFGVRRSIFLESDGTNILGFPGSFVELKFNLEGDFKRIGVYPKAEKKEEEPVDPSLLF